LLPEDPPAAQTSVPVSLLPLDQAVARVVERAQPLPAERVPLREAAGRILAAPVAAPRDLPVSDISMMDGYALRAGEGAPGRALRVAFAVAAGHSPAASLQPGEAARIFTGAALPQGADCVVMQEHCTREGDLVRVHPEHGPREGQHIRRRGEEVQKSAQVLPAGAELGPAELALLAACGVTQPAVHGRPRVAILCTGDELAPTGDELRPGQIYESNSHSLAQLVREAGGAPVLLGIAADRVEEIAGRLGGADADLLVSTGGASVGEHDHAQDALQRIGGALVFHQVAIRPGKPALFGTASRGRLLFGLPGNPAAASLCFELFVRVALRRLLGEARPERTRVRAVLRGSPLSRVPGLTFFPRGVLRPEGAGLSFTPVAQQSSMQIASWAGVNALGRIEPGSGRIELGQELDALVVRGL
jgi:molybdopterin molybdotransferase